MQTRRNVQKLTFFLIPLLIFANSCMKKSMPPPPPPPPASIIGSDSDRLQESLFKGDQAVLSNQDIERILGARVTVEDRPRMAVLGLVPRWAWSEEIADMESENGERFLQALKAAPNLTQVRFIPTLLVPEKRTVPDLREAAARFQADLLLVYATRVQSYRRDRFVGTDEVRAKSIVECVLLDVRTGIVLFAGRSSEGVYAKKMPGDLNFSETVAKSETEATGKALVKVAHQVVEFLIEAPK